MAHRIEIVHGRFESWEFSLRRATLVVESTVLVTLLVGRKSKLRFLAVRSISLVNSRISQCVLQFFVYGLIEVRLALKRDSVFYNNSGEDEAKGGCKDTIDHILSTSSLLMPKSVKYTQPYE